MSKKKQLLFLSPFFYPEMISTGRYNSYLVRSLVSHGWAVNVVASQPLYPNWKPWKSSEAINGVNIYRAGLYVRYPRSAVFRRLVLEFWFGWHAAWSTLRLRNEVDTVVAVFPPNFFMLVIGLALAKNTKKIGIVHDLQGIMAGSTESAVRRVIAKLVRVIEKMAFNRCGKLICLSESMRDVVVETYGIDKKKCQVHYPFPTIDVEDHTEKELLDVLPDGYFHIVYSGALGEKQRPELVMELFDALSYRRADIMCHLFSAGPVFDVLAKRKQRAGNTSRVIFHDLVPEHVLSELYERSTMQIIPQAEGVSAGAFPSKLPNLLKAGIPVFAICDEESELATVVRSSNIGRAAHTWDIPYLVEEIIEFLDKVAAQPHDIHRRQVNDYMKERFSLERLVSAITLD